jgi:hypothetical protein
MGQDILPIERIAQAILILRKQRVMFDYHLAVLYGIGTRALKQAVRRNSDRFPSDFMLELSNQEIDAVVSHFVIPNRRKLDTNRELAQKFSELEQRVDMHDQEIAAFLEAIRQLMTPRERPRREIGFHVREKAPRYRISRCA